MKTSLGCVQMHCAKSADDSPKEITGIVPATQIVECTCRHNVKCSKKKRTVRMNETGCGHQPETSDSDFSFRGWTNSEIYGWTKKTKNNLTSRENRGLSERISIFFFFFFPPRIANNLSLKKKKSHGLVWPSFLLRHVTFETTMSGIFLQSVSSQITSHQTPLYLMQR